MKKQVPLRFWIETIMASVTGFLCVLSLVWRDWLEGLLGWNPGQHSGSVGGLVVGGLFVVAATMSTLACVEWRRAPSMQQSSR